MANQNKLKAWVRVDGTNTIVLAGPIFSAKKPKDGKWKEINANLCCNTITPSTSTTTSTTTQGTSSYAWSAIGTNYPESGCLGGGTPLTLYSSINQLNPGMTVLYMDAALTTPYNPSFGAFVVINGNVCQMNNALVWNVIPCSQITTTTTTTTSAPAVFYNSDYTFGPVGNICAGTGQYNLPLVFPNGFCTSGNISLAPGYVWYQYGLSPGVSLSIKDPYSNNIASIQVQSGSAAYSYGCSSTC